MKRIAALDYIRAVAMCGVLMIHTGSYALSNPAISPLFIVVFEILTRFSIPVFFFVSAFGLFAGYNSRKEFIYSSFIKKRLKTVLIPYVAWSIIYITMTRDFHGLLPENLLWKLFFGLGSYQLYFIAILIWFYIFMPVWRFIIPKLAKNPWIWTIVLFAVQAVINYISINYLWNIRTGYRFLDALFAYRVNYWIAHYIFIFIFGGICALHKDLFSGLCTKYFTAITLFFLLSAANICGWCYFYIVKFHYTMLECINTFHQLSLPGQIYTLAATLFLFSLLSKINNDHLIIVLKYCANNSFTVYLVHPLFMYMMNFIFLKLTITYTVATSVVFFCMVLGFSLLFGTTLNILSRKLPTIGILLKGN